MIAKKMGWGKLKGVPVYYCNFEDVHKNRRQAP